MKYIAIILLLCISCGPETEMYEFTFLIKNDTPDPIKINFFVKNNLEDTLELQKIVWLQNNEIYKGNELEFETVVTERPNGATPTTSFLSNFIEIIYNNERKSVSTFSDIDNGLGFFSEPVERNLLRTGNYESIGNDEYLFTITQQDFDNATPCDGPCE